MKQIYLKANDVKLALLLLKCTPISNKNKNEKDHDPPAYVFFGRQLKVHLPVFRCRQHQNLNYSDICTNQNSANFEILSKYNEEQNVWVKRDSNTKWMPGKITQVSPNQSYMIHLQDGHELRRNEHHITTR